MKKLIIATMLSLALASCKTAEESLKESGNKPLSSTQIQKLLANSTISGTTSRGFDYAVYYKSDGTMRLKSRKYDETGKWRAVAPDKYCRVFPSLNNGQEICRHWYKTGKSYRSVKMDGTHSSDFKVVPGNPRKL